MPKDKTASHARVLAAAREEFLAYGFEKASMRRVGERCGLTAAGLYRHYTDIHHLNNLLWVWNCPLKEGYPGDEYVDVISVDIYLTEYKSTDYRDEYLKLINDTTKNKVAALAEVGYLPDIKMLEQSHTPWAYYMTWSKEI